MENIFNFNHGDEHSTNNTEPFHFETRNDETQKKKSSSGDDTLGHSIEPLANFRLEIERLKKKKEEVLRLKREQEQRKQEEQKNSGFHR